MLRLCIYSWGHSVKLSHELIESGQSDHGGWSQEQLALLGVEWPPLKGWKKRIVGREVQAGNVLKFLKLKNAHLKGKTK